MKSNRVFLITIDTEADNQWDSNQECTTENTKFLPRFQELAEKYGFKPTWLTTYEMAEDEEFVKYFKEKQDKGLCEIGMHLHAWNTPPTYELENKTNERSYLIEYPKEIMEEKIKNLNNLLIDKFGIKPISHRAGRWAMNEEYFNLLEKYGYKIDCSITPYINWKKNVGATGLPGPNYSKELEKINYHSGILEIPVTIKKIHSFELKRINSLKRFMREIQFFIFGRDQWIRPDKSLIVDGIKKVMDKCNKEDEYIMFMIHSSELMPGGSPNFKTKEDIEELYKIIEYIFNYSQKLGYVGTTLKEYYLKIGDNSEQRKN